MQIHLLTANADKLRHARSVFTARGIDVIAETEKITEIQAPTSREIARAAVYEARRRLGAVALLREDHSFTIDALGIPGPFMAYQDKQLSVETLVRIVDALPTRAAHFTVAAAFLDSDSELFETEYVVPVQIASEPRGDKSLKWERAIILEGDHRTMAEVPAAERDRLWIRNYEAIADFIGEKLLRET